MRLRDVLGSGKDHAQADVAPVIEPAEPTTPGAPKPPGPLRRLLGHRAPGSRTSAPGDRVQWNHGDRIATRLLHVVLVGALVSGPAAAVWVAVATSDHPAGSMALAGEPSTTAGTDATLAAATAQRLVLTWLTASAADKTAMQALLAAPLPAALELPEKRPAAPTQMWVGGVAEEAPGRFQVEVATSGGPLGAAYFSVPVRVEEGTAVALGLPARTRFPAAADVDRFRLPALTSVSTDDPAFQTAAGYVTAYLTGSAELDRWTGPNAYLTPVLPRACGSVRVDTVQTVTTDEAATTRADVIATATCRTAGRPSTTSQYGLVLQVRDGRWEVAAEDPALLLDPTSGSTSPTGVPSAPTSTPR